MSDLHALLIGIDAYQPNQIPGVGHYPLLQGCVRDVERVEEFLRKQPFLPLAAVEKLIAPVLPPDSPAPAGDLPTYENLVAALMRITDAASAGDAVYIHYSGHGNQAATAYPEVKGEGGMDEVVVPVDIGNSEARYLRDIEIAHYLRLMAEKGLFVTLVLDSCHSGGASRGEEETEKENAGKLPRRRGVSQPDKSKRPTDSLVATREELLASWRWHTAEPQEEVRRRDFQASTGWLPTPKGYVLIAACTPRQSAFEYAFEGGTSSGALTHFLLGAMADLEPGATYDTLFNRLSSRVKTEFPSQTPMLVGESKRFVLGPDRASADSRSPGSFVPSGVVVLAILEDRILVLNTGAAQGVLAGARFAVHPPEADLANPAEPLAVIEVVGYGATESHARIEGDAPVPIIPPGSRAVLIDPGSRRRTTIRLGTGLAPIADLLKDDAFLQWVEGEEETDFQVVVNDRREIEIQEPEGEPVPNLGPVLSAEDPAMAQTAVDRLVHLARNQRVRQLENRKMQQDLAGLVVAELLGVEDAVDTTRRPAPRATQGTASLEMTAGQWTYLRITNRSRQDLNIVVFDLQPDWGISQVYPGTGEGNLAPLDAGDSFVLPLQAQLPVGIDRGTDVLKVFATLGAADFRWLELPPLSQALDRVGAKRSLVAGASRPEWIGVPYQGWTTAQVEVRIERSTARATTPAGPTLRDGSAVGRF
jgi:hypothetical protein